MRKGKELFKLAVVLFLLQWSCVQECKAQGAGVSDSAYLAAGKMMVREGKLEDAERYYRAVLKIVPDEVGAWIELVQLYLDPRIQNAKKASEALSHIPQDKLAPGQWNFLKGYQTALQQKWAEAEQYYSLALEENPNMLMALNNRAESRVRQRKVAAARTDYNLLIKKDSMTALYYSNRAAAIYANQDYEEPNEVDIRLAMQDLNSALRLDSNFCTAQLNKAILHLRLKQNEEALYWGVNSMNCANNAATAEQWFLYGKLLHGLEKYDEALDAINYALALDEKLNRKNPVYMLWKGKALKDSEKYDEAEKELKQAIKYGMGGGEAEYDLAVVAAKREDKKDTYKWLKRSLENGYMAKTTVKKSFKDEEAWKNWEEWKEEKKWKLLKDQINSAMRQR